MPTFRRKPETVDARQFTGGEESGKAISLWVNANGGSAEWSPKRLVGSRVLSERVRLIISDEDYTFVWINHWVMHRQDGSWEALSPEDLKEEYEEV